jgi:signal transduction histidine kinase
MARLSTHHGEVPLTRVRARDVAAEALAMVEPQAEKAGLRTSLEVEENLWLSADPDRLRQVLLHLLDNGVKYAPAGTAIAVRCGERTDAGWGCLLVADEGHGIPPDQAEAIFEPGHRIGGGSDPGGTGLGLSIVKHLVQSMGGEIHVESELGEGTRFTFTLRCAAGGAS